MQPIRLRITCGEHDNTYDLKRSKRIKYSDQCDMHKITNEFRYDGNTFQRKEINIPLYKPNFSVFDSLQEKWTYEVQVTDKYNMQMELLKNETDALVEGIRLTKKTGYTKFGISVL